MNIEENTELSHEEVMALNTKEIEKAEKQVKLLDLLIELAQKKKQYNDLIDNLK